MKSSLIILLFCNALFAQNQPQLTQTDADSISYRMLRPMIPVLMAYPDDGLTYNQYLGEFISGYTLADGWRKDTVNGGINKEIWQQPYIESLRFYKQSYESKVAFYRYSGGKKVTGNINDTLTVTYTPPIVKGYLYGNPYYESQEVRVLFEAACVNGLLQGSGTLTMLSQNALVAQCTFTDGEITGVCTYTDPTTGNRHVITYNKGSVSWSSLTEFDKSGKIMQERKQ